MEKTKNIVLAGVVVAILVLGFAVLKSPNLPTAKDVANEISSKLGALVGPDIPYPYLKWGGVTDEARSMEISKASTTLCSFTSPAGTSTLTFASINMTTATGSAIVIDIGKSTLIDATTTLISTKYTLPADTVVTIVASGSATQIPT
ncbi:MAG: hypothetical protein US97_C0039G0005 [Microgenomates group bacterium GW2011_GWF1_38_5]|nr:MAG: hypothetical protein US97_C0039G0005 [Microgenomates group bacterium GW2011_GWF1_38_5]